MYNDVKADLHAAADSFLQYREGMSTSRLYKVFADLVANERLWFGTGLCPGSRTDVPFVSFERACRSEGSCIEIAEKIIGVRHDHAGRGAVLFVLAARAILAHNKPELADHLITRWNESCGTPHNADIDRLFLRIRCRVCDSETDNIFYKLLQLRPPTLGDIVVEWVSHKWRYEGPTESLFQFLFDVMEDERLRNKRMLALAVALAFRLDSHWGVDAVLSASPVAESLYDKVLPLAAYLGSQGRATQETRPFADLSESIAQTSTHMEQLVSERERSIAIVGNSGIELGQGKGELVDGHEEVVRFNCFSMDGRFKKDYGEKFTIHARGARNENAMNARSEMARLAVICSYDFVNVPRDWKPFVKLSLTGARLACLPVGFHLPIQRKLNADPSMGLAFSAYLKSVRGELRRESCFGFGFVDQIGAGAASAHYFEDARPALTHRWEKEQELFVSMLS